MKPDLNLFGLSQFGDAILPTILIFSDVAAAGYNPPYASAHASQQRLCEMGCAASGSLAITNVFSATLAVCWHSRRQ